jgi:hypothetical protein
MSRLNSSLNDEVVSGIHSVLSQAGIEAEELEDLDTEEELSSIQKVFKARGAGVAAAATRISQLMNADDDSIALRATEIALKANSVYTDAEKKVKVPAININIFSSGPETKNLVNLVMPTV